MFKTVKRVVTVEEKTEVGPGYLPVYRYRVGDSSWSKWIKNRNDHDETTGWLPATPVDVSPSGVHYAIASKSQQVAWLYVPEDTAVTDVLDTYNDLTSVECA